MEPIRALALLRETRVRVFHLVGMLAKMKSGPIFCQVRRIITFVQFRLLVVCGSQMWKGAIPIFIKRVSVIILLVRG